MCSTIWAWQFCYRGNILGSRPPQYQWLFWPPLAFHFDINFANGASYAWSSKHINMLGRVHGLFKYFLSWKLLKYWNQVAGTGKEWVAMGTEFFIAVGVLSVELLAYQVSVVCAGNWPRWLYLYTWYNIGLSI